jgi:hypothetical protein
MDLFQTKRKIENKFDEMLWQWKNGNKPCLTLEEAKELDNKYDDTVYQFEKISNIDCSVDAVVSFESIVKDDYSIALYSGIPELMEWASQKIA